MGAFEGLFGIAANALRGKPDMPSYNALDPQQEQKKAVEGNTAALPGIEKLASGVNAFNQQQIQKMLESSIPMYNSLKSGISSNIDSMMKGNLPKDVQDQIQNSAAARSMGSGVAGSGMGRNLVARDLGLNSLDLTQKGLSSAENWIKTMSSIEQPGMFNVSSMFLTPQQQWGMDTQERDNAFQYNWNKNLMDWQTSNKYAGANAIQGIGSTLDSAIGSYTGSYAGAKGAAAAAGGGGL